MISFVAGPELVRQAITVMRAKNLSEDKERLGILKAIYANPESSTFWAMQMLQRHNKKER